MAATIKPIEAQSVHQIQSGQVIVDLCSVAKELVENALDAEANAIEVRFKNYGLDAIEVQDNGTGISEANYEGLALKHYTSKLSTYDDLSELQTFGFRGEALSSLCALSNFSVVTAQAHEAPKGKRLEFEMSGKLKSTSFTAAQKGTSVVVESLFSKLPVRQKELSKNIKREYGKVLGLLQAYACISTKVKFTVKNAVPKGRSAVAFSTKGNMTTRENIANVYGAKMLAQLVELDLKLDLQPTLTQMSRSDADGTEVNVVGHISKPVFGEGRQTPDRQMFFVNGRPCGLPQIAKAINEVYKSYNVTQSAFIFADFRMDTNNYDVNVSPDKRTIFLHNAGTLTDRLKEELTKCFDSTEQTVPQSQVPNKKLPTFRQLTVSRDSSRDEGEAESASSVRAGSRDAPIGVPNEADGDSEAPEVETSEGEDIAPPNLLKAHFGGITSTREDEPRAKKTPNQAKVQRAIEKQAEKVAKAMEKHKKLQVDVDEYGDVQELPQREGSFDTADREEPLHLHVRDFNARIQEQQKQRRSEEVDEEEDEERQPEMSTQVAARRRRVEEAGAVPNAFERMRPRRLSPEVATITIGDRVITRMVGTPQNATASDSSRNSTPKEKSVFQFSQNLRKFDVENANVDINAGRNDEAASTDTEDSRDASRESEVAADVEWTSEATPFRRRTGKDNGESVNHFVDSQRTRSENSRHDLDETADRTQEEYRVTELIRLAEATNYANSRELQRRANQALKGGIPKDSTANALAITNIDMATLAEQCTLMTSHKLTFANDGGLGLAAEKSMDGSEEERLSLTISKSDFTKMHVAGQFNLGFIIALRYQDKSDAARQKDELFIIDQHASDEKYNFERLQAETVVGNQKLVHPVMLDLTAVEEEIVLENEEALQQNGFIIESDTTGYLPVGQRCKLLSLPLSKEVTFNTKDLEELIHLLSESHISADSSYIPRPGKVRKMFAMRACRSSIMIGKTLSTRQMRSVLEHMGKIDKPWNCPHGRPTMRHLTSLDGLDNRLWKEGDGLTSEDSPGSRKAGANVWKQYIS